MNNIVEYINIFEELSNKEKGNNVLIDKYNDYNLYCGNHLFKRLNRHVEDTYNIGDKISLNKIKQIIKKSIIKISNYIGNRLETNNPDSCICLVSTKNSPNLNIVCFCQKSRK